MSKAGPPKHQNKVAWKPNLFCEKNETEVGGKRRPYSDITGVCPRCKTQIEWKRKYGKYKPLIEPAKCQKCTKRAVRQAYHNLCSACAKDLNVCAKCSCHVERIMGRDLAEVEAEKKALEDALKNARERDRRTILRAMEKGKTGSSTKTTTDVEATKAGELFSAESLDEYAGLSRDNEDDDESEDEIKICN
ncbi:small acidic-like protein [Thalictrum thalictroides]|uniref:Small acidic-like protein n=1 Tax=Thalictrum thalictroides TaxID=46969 RepID=A0A7J6WAT2_THATH|nr:small acidic-like protein [Thalictrum thalictroides]